MCSYVVAYGDASGDDAEGPCWFPVSYSQGEGVQRSALPGVKCAQGPRKIRGCKDSATLTALTNF